MALIFNKLFGLYSPENRIVVGYVSVICIFLSLVLYSYFSINKINDIHLLKEHSLKLQKSLAEIKCASSQFILNDRTNITFFETGNSIYVERYTAAYASFTSTLDKTIEISESFNNNTDELKKLKREIEEYNNKFNEVKTKIKERGFGKYGIVGNFEKAMIQLMQYDFGIDNVMLSNMQLYVKDYILTGDTNTVIRLKTELYNFSLLLEKHLSDDKIDFVANLLNNYSETFNRMVAIDNELGRNLNEGMEKKLFLTILKIDENLKKESKVQEIFYKKLNKSIFRIYVVMVISSIGIALAISLYIFRNYNLQKLLYKELALKNEQIEKGSILLEREKENTLNSIRYAKTIQKAILPRFSELNKIFDSFVILRPRDIVSGDFLWFHIIDSGTKTEKCLIGAIDCTGHGVPGAFMSMIGNTLLNEIVKERKIHDPGEILDYLNHSIKVLLKQNESENMDGMDACFCLIERNFGSDVVKIFFAGAKRPLYYITPDNSKINILKGDRKFIGGALNLNDDYPFNTYEIALPKNTTLYLTTDGIFDQCNEQKIRLGKRKFEEFILNVMNLPMEMQKAMVEKQLGEFMGTALQRDDIALIGIKL